MAKSPQGKLAAGRIKLVNLRDGHETLIPLGDGRVIQFTPERHKGRFKRVRFILPERCDLTAGVKPA